jgi:O-acetyl-ADP-ribose deacetylase (regulator of RNase III)
MSSKTFFKKSVPPKLVHRFAVGNRSLEIWKTTCIVTNFGKTTDAACSVLINPSNPELSGVKNFPYFPRGGPVPKEKPVAGSMHKDWQPLGFVSNWGGMEVGSGMLYPVSVVDGLVHQMGGWKLEAECAYKRLTTQTDVACPVGTAVRTSAGGERLPEQYGSIIHTTPPFYKYENDPDGKLKNCYESALALAFNKPGHVRVATPLIGSGARGFPFEVAIEVASSVCTQWCTEGGIVAENQVLVFGLLEDHLANQFVKAVEQSAKQQGRMIS